MVEDEEQSVNEEEKQQVEEVMEVEEESLGQTHQVAILSLVNQRLVADGNDVNRHMIQHEFRVQD